MTPSRLLSPVLAVVFVATWSAALLTIGARAPVGTGPATAAGTGAGSRGKSAAAASPRAHPARNPSGRDHAPGLLP